VTFKLTAKQIEANDLLGGQSTHVMLSGGSRSGKTILILRAIAIRAMAASRSRHAILRYRFNACKTKIAMASWPEMMEGFFPQIPYNMNKEDWFFVFPNRSEVWFGGLDDKQRSEKILGGEYVGCFLNECSEIPWNGRNMALTRLAQNVKVDKDEGRVLRLKMFYDQNPPRKGHWTYKLFELKVDPDTKRALADSSQYVSLRMNPDDNKENLPKEYVNIILPGMSARFQRRFRFGEYAEDAPGALFNEVDIDKWRVTDGVLPEFQRVVIAVDPSGSDDEDNADNDEIGIMVGALGVDGNGYVLEDLTLKAGPGTWGDVVASAFDRHEADLVVGEENFGGAMVRHTIQTARPRTTYRSVKASRGKVVRATPISALVEKGMVRFAGYFPELEEELSGFTVNGYTGDRSPNRADAFVWLFAELFPGIISGARKREPEAEAGPPILEGVDAGQAWQGG
jgi:phage terminase large subunit-like protein